MSMLEYALMPVDPVDFTKIWSRFHTRWLERDNRMDRIERIVRGDWTVVAPDDEELMSRSPNLVQVALKDTAEASALVPSIRVQASEPTPKAKEKAGKMEAIGTSYLDASEFPLLAIKSFLDLYAYGFFSWVVTHTMDGGPRVEWRDPRTCFPEPDYSSLGQTKRCFFARDLYLTQLDPEYQAIFAAHCGAYGVEFPDDKRVTLVEYYDEDRIVVAGVYDSSSVPQGGVTYLRSEPSMVSVILEDMPNRHGMVPVVIGQVPDLDPEPHGQFDQVINILLTHIQLMAMLCDFSDDLVYCLSPETRVLTEELEYIPVGSLGTGDRIFGFDEMPGRDGSNRKWRSAVVTATGRKMLPSYRVTLADGTSIVASEDHKWLMANAGNTRYWETTGELYRTRNHGWGKRSVARLLDRWEQDNSRAAGYLAGMFDGEGHIRTSGTGVNIAMAQKDNEALYQVELSLKELGFDYSVYEARSNGVRTVYLLGGTQEALRFLGTVRPHRLISRFLAQGGAETLGRLKVMERVEITDIEFLGEREVVTLATSTKTLVAEGFAHHNSEVWVKDLIGNEMPQGGRAYIQLGPQGAIGRLPPASPSFSLFNELQMLVENFHLGARWPKTRPGDIDQSQASGKFVETTVGVLNTVIRTGHAVMQRALMQALRVCFKIDKELGPKRTVAGVLRNQQFVIERDRDDIDLAAQVRPEYGLGFGRDPAQSAVLAIQYHQANFVSTETVQENLEGIVDVALERKRLLLQQFKDMALAKLLQGLQGGTVPDKALVDIARDVQDGKDVFEVFNEHIVKPQEKMLEQQIPTGLSGMLSPGPAPAEPGGPAPQAPPPEQLLAGLMGGGGPPNTINRLSVPLGQGSFMGSQTTGP